MMRHGHARLNYADDIPSAFFEEIAFSLAHAAISIETLNDGAAASRPNEYARCELALLSDAVTSAEDRPDLIPEIWEAFNSMVCELNDHLAALEVPLLNFVTYDVFRTWIEPRQNRALPFDA